MDGNKNVIIISKFSLFAELEFTIFTTSIAPNDENFDNVPFLLQCVHVAVYHPGNVLIIVFTVLYHELSFKSCQSK